LSRQFAINLEIGLDWFGGGNLVVQPGGSFRGLRESCVAACPGASRPGGPSEPGLGNKKPRL